MLAIGSYWTALTLGFYSASLLKRSKNREGALAFLQCLSTPVYNREVNDDADGMCAFRKFANQLSPKDDPVHPAEHDNDVWIDLADHAVPDETSPYLDGATVSRLIQKQLELVEADEKDPVSAMRAAKRDIDAALAAAILEGR